MARHVLGAACATAAACRLPSTPALHGACPFVNGWSHGHSHIPTNLVCRAIYKCDAGGFCFQERGWLPSNWLLRLLLLCLLLLRLLRLLWGWLLLRLLR